MTLEETNPQRPPLRRFWNWLTETDSRTSVDPYAFVAPFNGPLIPSAFGQIEGPRREQESFLGGIVASARRLTQSDVDARNEAAQGGASSKTKPWQEEAWELLDLIGEQRFLSSTLAGRMSQAAFYVGKMSNDDSPGTRPEHVKEDSLQDLLTAIGDGVTGQAQLIHRAGVNLFVAGECWLIGIPKRYIPGTDEFERERAREKGELIEQVDRETVFGLPEDNPDDVLNLAWRMLSVSEVNVGQSGEVEIALEDGSKIKADADTLYMIRIWRPHPRRAWEADSPTRASLPVLRELLGLTQHISAQVDSRLAGAGLLAVSTEVDASLKRAAGIDENDPRSPLMEALTVAMQTPIKDRSAASALVPLAVTVPGDPAKAFHHMSFATPLDKEARQLRDEAIRRLALGQDAPPELLLGTGGMNHWGAWLVREDVVTTHLEPPLRLICDALTTQYLRPLMLQLGYSEDQIEDYVIWYDVDHLISRPNRSQDAKDLFDKGELSGEALREANGFETGDAPEDAHVLEPAVALAIDAVTKSPSLAAQPGLPILVEQFRAVLEGREYVAPEGETQAPSDQEPSSEGGIPNTADDPPAKGTPANPSEEPA